MCSDVQFKTFNSRDISEIQEFTLYTSYRVININCSSHKTTFKTRFWVILEIRYFIRDMKFACIALMY